MHKYCYRCDKNKKKLCFSKNNARPDKLSNICKDCMRIHKANRRNELRTKVNEHKTNIGCYKCGEKHPACLDFHHNTDKKDCISRMVSKGISFDTVLKEIEKCVVICSNCHRKLHWNEKE